MGIANQLKKTCKQSFINDVEEHVYNLLKCITSSSSSNANI